MVNGAPPADMTPEDLVVMLASRDPASDVVDFPLKRDVINQATGKPIAQMRMVVLKNREKLEAKRQASIVLRQQFKNDWNRDPTADDLNGFDQQAQFNDLVLVEMLVRACRTVQRINSDGPARYGAIFGTTDWMRENLTSDELAILFNRYMVVEIEQGPREQVLDDDPTVLRSWIARAKKGLWVMGPFTQLAWVDLAELTLGFAKAIDRAESSGFPILDPQFASLLNGSESTDLTTSPSDTTSSGQQPESYTPTTTDA